eukprot:sb/3473572/
MSLIHIGFDHLPPVLGLLLFGCWKVMPIGVGVSELVRFGLGVSILYQMPVSLLKSAMWLRGYSRLKKVGLGNKSVLFLLERTWRDRHTSRQRERHREIERERESKAERQRNREKIGTDPSICNRYNRPSFTSTVGPRFCEILGGKGLGH